MSEPGITHSGPEAVNISGAAIGSTGGGPRPRLPSPRLPALPCVTMAS